MDLLKPSQVNTENVDYARTQRKRDILILNFSLEEHDELWNIVNELLSETRKEIKKINNRISFQGSLLDPGNIEEEDQYLEQTKWMLRHEMKELKKGLIQPGMLESLTQMETGAEEEG